MVTVGSGARRYVAPKVPCRTESTRPLPPFRPIAEAQFDLRFSRRRVRLRIYAPRPRRDGCGWACRYRIDYPIGLQSAGVGDTSMQALFGAMRGVSRALYGSTQFKSGRLAGDRESRDLIVPATADLLGVAPFPF